MQVSFQHGKPGLRGSGNSSWISQRLLQSSLRRGMQQQYRLQPRLPCSRAASMQSSRMESEGISMLIEPTYHPFTEIEDKGLH